MVRLSVEFLHGTSLGAADSFEYVFKVVQMFRCEYVMAILGDKHQVGVKVPYGMTSSPDVRGSFHTPPRLTRAILLTVKKRLIQRAYLTGSQRRHASRLFGCCRIVFNDFIKENQRRYAAGEDTNFNDIAKTVLTEAKNTPERAWLAEVSAVPLQQSCRNAAGAFKNFFNGLRGKRKGKKPGFPRFKRKRATQSAAFTSAARFRIRVDGCSRWGFIRLPKFEGEIRFRVSQVIDWDSVKTVTLKRLASGDFAVSFSYEDASGATSTAPEGSVCGIDVGLTDLAAIAYSVGRREKIGNPRHLRRMQRKLRRQSRAWSKSQKGSANREKLRVTKAKAAQKVAARRKDFLDKLSSRLVADNQTICLETLNLQGLSRTRLSKSFADAGIGMFTAMLAYKSAWAGSEVKLIDRWEPTSQRCSICGDRGSKKPLHVRIWTCTTCGETVDRDYNAAVNIIDAAGHAESLNACGPGIRRTIACAFGAEAGTLRSDAGVGVCAVGISTL